MPTSVSPLITPSYTDMPTGLIQGLSVGNLGLEQNQTHDFAAERHTMTSQLQSLTIYRGLSGPPVAKPRKSLKSRDEGGRLNQGAGAVVFPRAELPLRPRECHDPPPWDHGNTTTLPPWDRGNTMTPPHHLQISASP